MAPESAPGTSVSIGHVLIRGARSGTRADALARAITAAMESAALDISQGGGPGARGEIPRLEVRVPARAGARELAAALARALTRAARGGRR